MPRTLHKALAYALEFEAVKQVSRGHTRLRQVRSQPQSKGIDIHVQVIQERNQTEIVTWKLQWRPFGRNRWKCWIEEGKTIEVFEQTRSHEPWNARTAEKRGILDHSSPNPER